MPNDLTFVRVYGSIFRLGAAEDIETSGYWAGAISNDPNIENVLSTGSVFLFLRQVPSHFDTFESQLVAFLQDHPGAGVLWLDNPNDDKRRWMFKLLDSQLANGLAVNIGGDYAFSGPLKSMLQYVADNAIITNQIQNGFTDMYAALGASILVSGSIPASFTAKGTLLQSVPLAQGAMPILGIVPLSGPYLGRLTSQFGQPGTTNSAIATLSPGVRYVVPDPTQPGRYESIDATLLGDGAGLVTFFLDPLDPFSGKRTFFAMEPDVSFGSTLRTTTGGAIGLTTGKDILSMGRLVFCKSLAADGTETYHLAPDGKFQLSTNGDTRTHLAVGLSGSEYVAVGSEGATVLFEAGKPAFVDGSKLTSRATTAYVTFLRPDGALQPDGARGLPYCAQSAEAPLFATTAKGQALEVLSLAVSYLPAGQGASAQTFPLFPFAGTSPQASAATVRHLEEAVLAPERHRIAVSGPDTDAAASPSTGETFAVTPSGTLFELSDDGTAIKKLVVGKMGTTELFLSPVDKPFRNALLSPTPFFVVSDPGVLAKIAGGLSLDLDGWTIDFHKAPKATDPQPPTMLLFKYGGRTLEALVADTSAWGWHEAAASTTGSLGPTQAAIQNVFDTAARRAAVAVAGPDDPYARFYKDVVTNPDWTGMLALNAPASIEPFPEGLRFLTAGLDLKNFYAHHIGFPLTSLETTAVAPPVTPSTPTTPSTTPATPSTPTTPSTPSTTPATPATPSAPSIGSKLTWQRSVDAATLTTRLKQSDIFGLIAYDDPQDLFLSSTDPIHVAFKVMQLTVVFARSKMTGFSARVELMLNQLFESELTMVDPQRGNNLIMSAGTHSSGTVLGGYAFHLEQTNRFDVRGSALSSIEILDVRLHSETDATTKRTTSRFEMSGRLRFTELDAFDLFSYGSTYVGNTPTDGYLAFRGLSVTMTFDAATPTKKDFVVDASGLSFDLGASLARPLSLAANFPVHLSGFLCAPKPPEPPPPKPAAAGTPAAPAAPPAKGQTPESLGYVSVLAPLDQVPLAAPWYGLVFTLDLGTHGALAAQSYISVSVLAGWMGGGGDTPQLFLGMRLPDAKDTGVEWPMQGVFRLGFRDFRFDTETAADGMSRAYALRLHKLALSVLGWSFPPGNMDVVLFGEPGGAGDGALGWYAAYEAKDPNTLSA